MPPYSITNAADGTPVIKMNGYIGRYDEINAVDFMAAFDEATKGHNEIIFEINCGGGSVIEGFAIFDQVKTRGKKITVKVFGIAASMGFTIMLLGDTIEMTPNARLMCHRVSLGISGDPDQIRRAADQAEQYENQIISAIVARTGLVEATVKTWFQTGQDKWFSAMEAKANGIIDTIIDGSTAKNLHTPPENATTEEIWKFYNTYNTHQPVAEDAPNHIDTMPHYTEEQLALLGLSNTATEAEVTDAMKKMKDAAKIAQDAHLKAILDDAVTRGKINEAARPHFENIAKKDFEAVKAMIEVLPVQNAAPATPPAPPVHGSINDVLRQAQGNEPQNAVGIAPDRAKWTQMDWLRNDSAGFYNLTPEVRSTIPMGK